ncbi:MAG: class I SAM-dependent methyltransferase [Patescibacteria group bacterium]
MNKNSHILTIPSQANYELLDSGEGEKLERFGAHVLSRPDPQALWNKSLPETDWKKADAYFTRDSSGAEWAYRGNMPLEKWSIEFGGLKLWIKPTAFKHTGLFPEQASNWSWLQDIIKKQKAKSDSEKVQGVSEDIEVLNLFGYTGGASLACAQAGAKVVHIDSSKAAVTWARENAELSGLSDKPIRWIVEDVRAFVEREIKRGRTYDGIIMDPPAFGHGPDSEVWKIEEHFRTLVEECKKLLKPLDDARGGPLFFLINGYSAGYSAIAYENNLLSLQKTFGGEIEIGELTLQESGPEKRLLPCGIFARWGR